MAFKVFTVPIQDPGAAEAELNGFLRTHKVLGVERRWVEQGSLSFWSFCVDYFESARPASMGPMHSGKPKVDYREILSPEDFAVFAKLRDLRKEIAQAEAVAVYTVFTNEQLANMVRGKVQTKAALAKIEGIGEARLEKYGARVLDFLQKHCDGRPAAGTKK